MDIPKDLTNFLLVFIFSFLIGLEQRRVHSENEFDFLFGTDRTITLIGILGFLLYVLDPKNLLLFLAGGAIMLVLLGIYYYNKIKLKNHWGLTSIVIAFISYCFAPLVYLFPLWLVMAIFVTILIVVEIKESLFQFSKKFDRNEFTTLAKFIIIAGIVLPLLPRQPISQMFNISPYQIWLSIVVVSGISYISYLFKKFIFPTSGIVLSAILGGLYSSTATTVILARKSKEDEAPLAITTGIFIATAMMYVRILLLAWFFNQGVALKLLPPFFVFIVVIALFVLFLNLGKKAKLETIVKTLGTQNPLEFKIALIFGLLFTFFSIVTKFVEMHYGALGVNILSFVVGVTDIDPYILNLFQSNTASLDITTIARATIIASASNNLVKMIYAFVLGSKTIRTRIAIGFSILFLVNIIAVVV